MSITREVYKAIKRMDRRQVEEYVSGIYAEGKKVGIQEGYKTGYEEGVKNISKVISPKIENAIRNTSGIGEKRFHILVNNIVNELKGDLEK